MSQPSRGHQRRRDAQHIASGCRPDGNADAIGQHTGPSQLCVLPPAFRGIDRRRRRLGSGFCNWQWQLYTNGDQRGALDHHHRWGKRHRQRCCYVHGRVEHRRRSNGYLQYRRLGVHRYARGTTGTTDTAAPAKLLVFDCAEQSVHRRCRRHGLDDNDFDICRMRMDGVEPVSWITLTSAANGSGPGTVTFNAGANNGNARSGNLTVAGQTFTVNQAAAPPTCSFSISPGNQSIGANGGMGVTVAVSTSAGCAWTAKSNVAWMTLISGASGSGAGTVTFSVAANTTSARNGTLTIAGQTFTVNQASGCTYSIKPDESIDQRPWRRRYASRGVGGGWLQLDGHEQRLVDHGHYRSDGERQRHGPVQCGCQQWQEKDRYANDCRSYVHGRSGQELGRARRAPVTR